MRPILLKGHERALTFVKYNREGDLLFSSSKDTTPCLWRSDNGERIGTYKGHSGTVWALDVTYDSKLLITGSADNSVKLWRVETGEEIYQWIHRAPVRFVSLAEGDRSFLAVTDSFGKQAPSIHIYKLETDRPRHQSSSAVREIPGRSGAKITCALWGPLNKYIISSSEDCSVSIHDPETGELIHHFSDHTGPVNSISFSHDEIFFITSSDDRTAKLYDSKTFKLLKTYETGKPVNSAAISPLMDHVLLGGGQKAHGVTTSHAASGQFEARVFHMIFEEELASIKGHFGPINTMTYSPDGRSYVSGSEDGYIRLHHLDAAYFKLTGVEDLDASLSSLDLEEF